VKEQGGNMYNILVCDDEKDIVSAIKIYFEAEGYTDNLMFAKHSFSDNDPGDLCNRIFRRSFS